MLDKNRISLGYVLLRRLLRFLSHLLLLPQASCLLSILFSLLSLVVTQTRHCVSHLKPRRLSLLLLSLQPPSLLLLLLIYLLLLLRHSLKGVSRLCLSPRPRIRLSLLLLLHTPFFLLLPLLLLLPFLPHRPVRLYPLTLLRRISSPRSRSK